MQSRLPLTHISTGSKQCRTHKEPGALESTTESQVTHRGNKIPLHSQRHDTAHPNQPNRAFPLLSTGEAIPGVLCSALASQYKRDMAIVDTVPQRVMKMMRTLAHLLYEGRLRELGLFSLKKAQRDLINVYKCLKGGAKTDPGSSQWCPGPGPEAMDTN